MAEEADGGVRPWGDAGQRVSGDGRCIGAGCGSQVRRRFIDGPGQILPASEDVNWNFDPNGLITLSDDSVVYTSLRITDAWGILEASGGGLMVREKDRIRRVVVPAPANAALSGDGWKLELKPGFKVVPGARREHFTVEHEVQR